MCYYYDYWRSVTATTTLKHNWMSRTPQGYSKSFLGFKWEHLVQRVMISWFCKLLTSNMWKVDCVDNVKVLKWKTLQDDSCCGSLEVFFFEFLTFWTFHAVFSLPAATSSYTLHRFFDMCRHKLRMDVPWRHIQAPDGKHGTFLGSKNPPKVMIHQGPSRVCKICKMLCLQFVGIYQLLVKHRGL